MDVSLEQISACDVTYLKALVCELYSKKPIRVLNILSHHAIGYLHHGSSEVDRTRGYVGLSRICAVVGYLRFRGSSCAERKTKQRHWIIGPFLLFCSVFQNTQRPFLI